MSPVVCIGTFSLCRGFYFKDKGIPVTVSLFYDLFFIELHFEPAKLSVIMSFGLFFSGVVADSCDNNGFSCLLPGTMFVLASTFLAQKQAFGLELHLPFAIFACGKGPFKRKETIMLAYTFVEQGRFELREKPRPELQDGRDAIVRVTLGSICTSDLHIKHGSVPRAVPGITVGHEMVGVVEEVGREVTSVKPGDRVTVNVETFCGECFFCRHGYVNNCTDPHGGWALGCRIDGGQAEFVRVPYADQGLNVIPPSVTDEQALFVGDILATGFWAARISEIKEEDTVLIIGAGPTGICTLQCAMLKNPHRVIVCERSEERLRFVREHYPGVEVTTPEGCKDFVLCHSAHGGADVVLEVAGGQDSFRLAWECARPNAVVTVVALYDKPQLLPLPDMYGKNLTFKPGGVDGCDCAEILSLLEAGRIDTTPLITHRFPLERIEEAYRIFENRLDGVIKVAVTGRGR